MQKMIAGFLDHAWKLVIPAAVGWYVGGLILKNKDQKERYLNRHKKRENWDSYMTAGSLSRWILWNKETIKSSISDYLKRFELKLKK